MPLPLSNPWRTAWSRPIFRELMWNICISYDFRVSSRYTLTVLVCPIRWQRAWAWRSFWGLKSESYIITVSAAVKFMPIVEYDRQIMIKAKWERKNEYLQRSDQVRSSIILYYASVPTPPARVVSNMIKDDCIEPWAWNRSIAFWRSRPVIEPSIRSALKLRNLR